MFLFPAIICSTSQLCMNYGSACAGWSMGVRRSFSRGGNISIIRLLIMQWKCTFTKGFTFSTRLHHKEKPHVTTTVTKMRLFGRHSQVYYDNFHNTLSADFQSRIRLFTEVLSWLSQKQQTNARESVFLYLLLPQQLQNHWGVSYIKPSQSL